MTCSTTELTRTNEALPKGTVAYTDASCAGNRMAATAAIIVCNGVFKKEFTKRYPGRNTSYTIELEGVISVLEWMLEHRAELCEPFIVRTDCQSISDLFKKHKDAKNIKRDHFRWVKIFQMTKALNAKLEYFQGHKEGDNPNKECDRMAKIACGMDL